MQNKVAGSPFLGNQFVELDAFTSTGIAQEVATKPGCSYELSFAFSARPRTSAGDNVLRVTWNGQQVAVLSADGLSLAETKWTIHTFIVASGSGSTTRLTFEDAGFSNSLGTYIDAVSVIAYCSVRVVPNTGGDIGSVSVRVFGAGLMEVSSLKLARSGLPDIVAGNLQVSADHTVIGATLDLAGKLQGAWNVVVTYSTGASVTVANGFTIEPGRAPQLIVDLLGRGAIRPAVEDTFWIAYTNSGNVDAVIAYVYVEIPPGVRYRFGSSETLNDNPSGSPLLLLVPRLAAGETRFSRLNLVAPPSASSLSVRMAITGSFAEFFPGDPNIELFPSAGSATNRSPTSFKSPLDALLFPAVNAGGSCPASLQPTGDAGEAGTFHLFRLADGGTEAAVSVGGGDIAWSAPPLNSPVGNVNYKDAVSKNGLKPIMSIPLSPLKLDEPPGTLRKKAEGFNKARWVFGQPDDAEAKLVPRQCQYNTDRDCSISCNGFATVMLFGGRPADFRAPGKFNTGDLIGYLLDKLGCSTDQVIKLLEPLDLQDIEKQIIIRVVNSYDPNDKVGVSGSGPARYVAGEVTSRYVIFFENLSTATAPAQQVSITDQIDLQNFDVSTVSLGPISFSNRQIVPPPGATRFTTTVDLRPTTDLLVGIAAGLDPSTGVLSWRFTSLDPTTLLPPINPFVGFLPPNRSASEGEGSVVVTISPKKNMPTGTQIRNRAAIVFDINAPILTPEWLNTIDSSLPTSRVVPLPATQSQVNFTVQWSGSDLGAGIRDFTIYVSDNSGPLTTWQQNVTATSALFTGIAGHTYSFYSTARDLVGNIEPSKTSADATTTVLHSDTTPPLISPQIIGTLGTNGWYRSTASVSWNVSDPESGIASSSGCVAAILTAETAGVTLTCSATNGAGLSASVPVTIKIDKVSPTIAGMPVPNCSIWPPNKAFVQIANITATDNLSNIAGPAKISITSNEPVGLGDIVVNGGVVQVIADRLGNGTGRVYTVTAHAADLAGNTTTVVGTCTVPRDQSR